MTPLYEKRGRRYHPVAERDAFDSWPHGAHLVVCRPGSLLTRYDVNPADAELLAAAEPLRGQIRETVSRMLEMRPARKPLTERQAAAWAAMKAEMGDDRFYVEYPSVAELADAVVDVLIKSAAAARPAGATGSASPFRED